MNDEQVIPDLQCALLCEDMRREVNGMQSLMGVLNVIPAPNLPVTYFRLCLWTRWCSGMGRFMQRARILAPDDGSVVVQADMEFALEDLETHTTNVNGFGNVQFQQFGVHHVEIYIDDRLMLRFPLPVVQVAAAQL